MSVIAHLIMTTTMTVPLSRYGLPHGYIPFLTPLPVGDYWFMLLVPLCLGISIVYKSVRCHTMAQVPREALGIFVWILIAMLSAGAALYAIAMLIDR